jgi:hypothetical protein
MPVEAPLAFDPSKVPSGAFKALLEAYRPYRAAIKQLPYDPVKVQALGMAFYDAFKAQKENLCKSFSIPSTEFDYSLHHKMLPLILEGMGE